MNKTNTFFRPITSFEKFSFLFFAIIAISCFVKIIEGHFDFLIYLAPILIMLLLEIRRLLTKIYFLDNGIELVTFRSRSFIHWDEVTQLDKISVADLVEEDFMYKIRTNKNKTINLPQVKLQLFQEFEDFICKNAKLKLVPTKIEYKFFSLGLKVISTWKKFNDLPTVKNR